MGRSIFLAMQTMASPLKCSLLLLCLLALPSPAEAKKQITVKNGRAVVVHTNPAPVLVHRAFPPYGLGRHVYSGRTPLPPASGSPPRS